jgi:hypothetical protein
MKHPFQHGGLSKLDLNSNKRWSKVDVRDLKASVVWGDAIDETAQHLCRGIEETKAKAKELGLAVRRRPAEEKRKPGTKKVSMPKDLEHLWKGRRVPDRVVKRPKDDH